MKTYISSADELRAEILRLKAVEHEQAAALIERVKTPSALFSTVMSLFRSPDSKGGFFSQDFFGLASRVLLPLTLNKTLFRKSNFLVKAAVGFVSQKASHLISEETITGVWDKITGLFHKQEKKEKDPQPPLTDNRIPPLSEPADPMIRP